MMWLGLSAILVGIISIAVVWPWQAQLIAFAVFAIASIPAWRRFRAQGGAPTESPFLNRRAEGYVGRVFTLDKPIVDGVGTIRIDDTVWRVSGPDCPAGSRVKIAQRRRGEPCGRGDDVNPARRARLQPKKSPAGAGLSRRRKRP